MTIKLRNKETNEILIFSDVKEFTQFCFEHPILCEIKTYSGVDKCYTRKNFELLVVKYKNC